MMIIWKNIFILLFVLISSLLNANNDFSQIDIEEEFYPYLTAKKRYMNITGVKEFLTPSEERIIVCIVSMENKGNTGSAWAKMVKICRIKAQVELLKADGYELSAFTKVEDRIVSISDGKTEKITSLSTYLNIAEEKVNGVVRSWPVIGTWYSKDNEEFYLAIGAIFEKK